MGRMRVRRTFQFALLTLVASLAAAAPAAGAAPRWRIQPTPNPRNTGDNELTAISCTSASACIALGDGGVVGTRTIAEQWNGTSWRIQPTPDPKGNGYLFNGVSCATPTVCYAVGELSEPGLFRPAPMMLRRGRRGWRALNPAGINGENAALRGISCPTLRFCLAVGTLNGGPLALRWNGRAWRIVPVPQGGRSEFDSVSCQRANACVVVGALASGDQLGLAERWNGGTWTVQSIPSLAHASDATLESVSCASGRACVAVGNYGDGSGHLVPLSERWNGHRWIVLRTPKGPGTFQSIGLVSVSCANAHACSAVGFRGSARVLAESWNGARWTVQSTPRPSAGADSLVGVSCASAVRCTAVGNYDTFTDRGPGILAMAYS